MRRILVACVCLLAPTVADEIVLKSGGRLSCEVVEETQSTVKVRMPNGTMVIPRSRIEKIVRERRGDYLKREGGSRLEAGSTSSAVELYRRALAEDPSDPQAKRGYVDALLAHARFLRGTYRLSEASAVLDSLQRLDPSNAKATTLRKEIRAEKQRGQQLHTQAVTALARGDFNRALALFDAWRLRRPPGDEQARQRMASAHIAAGEADLERGSLRGALDHFRAAASHGAVKQTARGLFLLAPVAILEALHKGETALARRAIDSIAHRYPDRAVPLFLKAVTHHLSGEVAEAVRAYADASREAEAQGKVKGALPYKVVVAQATATLRAAIGRPPQEGTRRWRELFLDPLHRHDDAQHFTVFAATQKQAEELGKRADELYARIAGELLGRPPSAAKAELVLHPTRQAYVAADPVPPNSPLSALTLPRTKTGGVAYDTLDEMGRPVVRIEVCVGDPRLYQDTLPHEIVHVVQRRGLAIHRRGHWLDEGLAMLYESERGRAARRADMRRTKSMPLAELLAMRSTPPDRGDLFYDQAHSLTEYLRGLGTPNDWRRFLDRYATTEFAKAIAEVYGIESLDVLERGWLSRVAR